MLPARFAQPVVPQHHCRCLGHGAFVVRVRQVHPEPLALRVERLKLAVEQRLCLPGAAWKLQIRHVSDRHRTSGLHRADPSREVGCHTDLAETISTASISDHHVNDHLHAAISFES
ncbi:hypothetical protein G6F22_020211 [Rhizopus arrhizus]|uniref:Uncharacterized protein n=1 Tax=Rhizopus oryzae TaxID=64495 RepID=A0A9P6WTP6_RHIOR|nr:hypothetical protein G6F22_020211 [Rhizopus arrhizus]KAG1284730.1 hypothetical protein G6F64_014287 [Rhizopus arrhizus]